MRTTAVEWRTAVVEYLFHASKNPYRNRFG